MRWIAEISGKIESTTNESKQKLKLYNNLCVVITILTTLRVKTPELIAKDAVNENQSMPLMKLFQNSNNDNN